MTNQKTIMFVFGTRPELIKVMPLIIEARKNPNIKAIACSTGQHKDMLNNLYAFFDIQPDIDFKLMKPNQSLLNLHAETMNAMHLVLLDHKPDWVVVQGDTTSAHAAAMSAFYQKIPVAHVEAGLRTYDIHSPFPEEMNRRAIGLVAKAHLCPTLDASLNLKNELIDLSSFVEVTGNTGIDTLKIVSAKIDSSENLQKSFADKFTNLDIRNFILVTMHRRENFGKAQQNVLKAFLEIIHKRQIDILFPMHPNPNVRKSIDEVLKDYKPEDYKGRIILTDPLDYIEMVYAMKKCRFLMTDSGGLQEEAPTFGKKLLVLRNSTERPEGVNAGFSELVGTDYDKIISSAISLIDTPQYWTGAVPANPYGDGTSSQKIIDILLKN
ncbi:UDP-N-acetylglucosamine 2-epimerase (non-hydrolyzing) [bacterium]|nr:UDP-N-acetylglucosamine 2-epimerase (non-hydrolyzing) [bacterium]